jgi:hypothetical protein
MEYNILDSHYDSHGVLDVCEDDGKSMTIREELLARKALHKMSYAKQTRRKEVWTAPRYHA